MMQKLNLNKGRALCCQQSGFQTRFEDKSRGLKRGLSLFAKNVLGLGLTFGLIFSSVLYADIIQTEESAKTYIGSTAQQILQNFRTLIEQIQNKGINQGLYLQGDQSMDSLSSITANHFASHCSQTATNETANSKNCLADILLGHGDIKFSQLVSSLRYNATQTDASTAFINNLVAPNPQTPFSDPGKVGVALSNSGESAKVRSDLGQALVDQALISVARQAFAAMAARRTPADAGGSQGTSIPTIMELMDKEASQRFLSDEWMNKMAEMNPAAADANLAYITAVAAREQVLISAFRAWMDYQHYLQHEQTNALLAALLVQTTSTQKAASSQFKNAQQQMPNVAPPSPGFTTPTIVQPNASSTP